MAAEVKQPDEEWRDIPGYEGYYQVSNLGRVRSLDRVVTRSGFDKRLKGKILLGRVVDYGRIIVSLSKGGVVRRRKVHSLVMEAFVGPYPDGLEIRHLDGDPSNNCIDNLRYGTSKENARDKLRHGTYIHGERHPLSRLKDEDILEIRRMYVSGEATQAEIGERYGIWQTHVGHIVHGESWPHLPFPNGRKKKRTKLTEENVIEMRRLFRSGEADKSDLTTKYGVTLDTVNRIVAGTRWPNAGLGRGGRKYVN